jgi:hypothetical protein
MNFGRAAIARVTWKRVMTAELWAFVLLFREWLGLESAEKFSRYMAIESFSYGVTAFLMLLGVVGAEEGIRRGARPLMAYAIGLILASLCGAVLFTSLWFEWEWRRERSLVLFILENAVELAVWGALAVFVYYNRMQVARMRAGVRDAQMKRVQLEQSLVESRLEATRAQIDAPALFAELSEIRDSMRRVEPQAVDALERLIQRLRESQTPPAQRYNAGLSA